MRHLYEEIVGPKGELQNLSVVEQPEGGYDVNVETSHGPCTVRIRPDKDPVVLGFMATMELEGDGEDGWRYTSGRIRLRCYRCLGMLDVAPPWDHGVRIALRNGWDRHGAAGWTCGNCNGRAV